MSHTRTREWNDVLDDAEGKFNADRATARELQIELIEARKLIRGAVDACTYDSEADADAGHYGLPPSVLIPMSVWLAKAEGKS